MFGLPRIYLASKSPRRRELLKQIGVAFDSLLLREHAARGPDVDETPLSDEDPREYVARVSRMKAEAGWLRIAQRNLPRQPVLAADTTVALDGLILGKPQSKDDAAAMLRLLSASEHIVLTAASVKYGNALHTEISETRVRFSTLDERDIDAYVATGEPFDKAGGYAIQGHAQAFIPEIQGSYSGVVGLPLHETVQLLRRLK